MIQFFTNLPWNPSKDKQQAVIEIEPVLVRVDMSDPVHVHGAERLDVGVSPGEGDAHPQPDEDAEQLDDVRVGHGVEPAEQRVEHRHARAEDHRRAVVHVNDHRQGGSCGRGL